MRVLFYFAVVLALGACAQSPDTIQASHVSDVAYRPLSCADLARERSSMSAALASATKQQSEAATGDAIGVFWVGIPVASVSGMNVGHEVARLRGEIEAIDRVRSQKSCAVA